MSFLTKLKALRHGGPSTRRARWLASLLLIAAGLVGAQPATAAGLLETAGAGPDLELAEHHVLVTLENGYSVTEVDQTFRNPHSTDRHARYSFPVPKDAAVGEFTYWIDGKPVHAEVLKKTEARQLHETEKQQGRETALVEQDGHRTFDVDVSPIRAGQDVRIRLVYLQKLIVDHSLGRYVYPLEDGGVDAAREAFWTRNESVLDAFSFRLKLRSAYPIDAVRATRKDAVVTQASNEEWTVAINTSTSGHASIAVDPVDQTLQDMQTDYTAVSELPNVADVHSDNVGVQTLDQDIVVYWRLAENLPGDVDLLTFRDSTNAAGTFMLTLTPGMDLNPITEGRDWVFVLDTSGSMQQKFPALVDGVRRALNKLNPADRFKIILFNDSASEFTRGYVPADRSSIDRTLSKLDRLQTGGSTNLFDGLKTALRALNDDRTSAIVLVTDGVANVGPTQLTEFLDLIENVDVRLFTAIMGNSANEPLLEGLTRHMEGFAMNVSNDDDIVGLMLQMTSKVTHEAMHNVQVSIDGVRTRNVTSHQFSRVYRGEQLILMGRYAEAGPAVVKVEADISGQRTEYVANVEFPALATKNPELERLWAFATIKELQAQQELLGETQDSTQGITDMALAYGLVTDYTSLIVVRDEIFEQQGIDRANASRTDRERLARVQRASAPVQHTQQSTNQPAFPTVRHTTSNGGGSLGFSALLMLISLAGLRARRKNGSE